MTSPLLALFIRSLREDSRLKFTYFSRALLVTIILLFLVSTKASFGWNNAPGLRFFTDVVGIDLCFVVLAGVSYFSSAISEEKEEMTLGLLRMTNLNPLSILLGKSTSRLWTAILLFTAQIPFTLLAITLGGISMQQIFAGYFTIGAFLIFVSNLGLLASVLCRRPSGSSLLTGILLLLFFAGVPVAAWFAQLPIRLKLLPSENSLTHALERLSSALESASPFERIDKILTTGFHGHIVSVQVLSNLLLGVACFLISWLVFERFCGDIKESAPSRVGIPRARGKGSIFSPSRPWPQAIAWKEFYFTTGGKLWILIKLLIYGTPLVVIRCWPQRLGGPPNWPDFGVGMFWTMVAFASVEIAFAAGSIFSNEHRGQTLSSLAMLPQGLRYVAYQKLLGVIPALSAAGFYLALSVPLVVEPFEDAMATMRGNEFIVMIFMGSQGFFFLHLVTVLSLYVKRGALPLAIGVQVLIFFFLATAFTVLFRDESAFLFLALLTFGAAAFVHVHIGHRLEALAAEG